MAQARGLPVKAFWIFLLAAAVGAFGGALSAGFQYLLRALQGEAMGSGEQMSQVVPDLRTIERLLVPTLGGLAAAMVLLLVRNQRWPFGITDIIELIATRKGTIRPLHSLAQILSSACSISPPPWPRC